MSTETPEIRLGVDTGGTFTDFVLYEGGCVRIHKVSSTPRAPEQSILQGLEDLGVRGQGLRMIHGSTVATNAVLEGKGARTVFITNRGLADLLTIGRQARRELYNLLPERIPPPVPRELCLETGGRLGADGQIVDPLLDVDIAEMRTTVQALAPQSVAINLLFSFLDPCFEQALAAAMPEGVFVSRSSEVLREYREYERGITTWLNAYVGPLVQGYLARLEALLPKASITVMQSSGETCAAALAGRRAVHLLLSGPAGGLMGARFVAAAAGYERLLTLDMGGTSTDVAAIDGAIGMSAEGRIGAYPVAVPMVDLHTIGAGGGSIAYVDRGGLLRVGPESAGAEPGPACYGRGGTAATVTDANLILGRLSPSALLGGKMSMDLGAARTALGSVAHRLGAPSIEAAAEGIVRVANEHIASALRVVSIQRGLDPREFVLVCFGGAGGLHACELAQALRIPAALVPANAGVLSALGMLVTPRGRRLSRTLGGLLAEGRAAEIERALHALAAEGKAELQREGIDLAAVKLQASLDLRYRGQAYTLEVPWRGVEATTEGFHLAHARRYGHRLHVPVELVNPRLTLHAAPARLELPRARTGSSASPVAYTRIYGFAAPVGVWRRQELTGAQAIQGPAILIELGSTTFIAPAWICRVDLHGNLHLSQQDTRGSG